MENFLSLPVIIIDDLNFILIIDNHYRRQKFVLFIWYILYGLYDNWYIFIDNIKKLIIKLMYFIK